MDARTDLFSFGAVLYEMATGKMAFPGTSAAVIHDAILNRTPVPASQVNQGLPPKLDEIIYKALEKDRKLRYQSAAEIRTDLQRLKQDSDSGRAAVTTAQVESKVAIQSTRFRWLAVTVATSVLLLAMIAGWLGWSWWQYHRWSQLAEMLANQPGLTITSFGRERGRVVIYGLRDPLAPDPMKFVEDAHLDPSRVEFHWGAYNSIDDSLVQQRAIAALSPPADVSLTVKDGVLHLDGTPSSKWVNELSSRALLIPGVRGLDLGRFTPERRAFNEAKSKLQSEVIKFPLSSPTLSSAELTHLRSLLPTVKQLVASSAALQSPSTLEVVGHSDTTEATNQSLSQRRADRIVAQFIRFGIPNAILHAKGVGTADPVRPEDTEENRRHNRRATFRVIVTPSGQP